MTQPPADRRNRERYTVGADCELIAECELVAGDVTIPATMVDVSAQGFRARVAPGALDGLLNHVKCIRLAGQPPLEITRVWSGNETFAATYDNCDLAEPVISKVLKHFQIPKE